MKPGRELDALVAEKVMGWTEVCGYEGEEKGYWKIIPKYSTDIAAAFQVRAKAGITQITWVADNKVIARFGTGPDDLAEGESEAHAICLAALKARSASE